MRVCHFQDYFLFRLLHFLQRSQSNLQTFLPFPCHFYMDPRGNIMSPLLCGFDAVSIPGHCTPAGGFDGYSPERLTAAINPGEVKRNGFVCADLSLGKQRLSKIESFLVLKHTQNKSL